MRSLTRSHFPAKTLKFLLSTCASSLPELAPYGKIRKSLAAQWSDRSPQLIVLFRLAFLAMPKKPCLTRIRSLRDSSIRPSPAGTFTFQSPSLTHLSTLNKSLHFCQPGSCFRCRSRSRPHMDCQRMAGMRCRFFHTRYTRSDGNLWNSNSARATKRPHCVQSADTDGRAPVCALDRNIQVPGIQ